MRHRKSGRHLRLLEILAQEVMMGDDVPVAWIISSIHALKRFSGEHVECALVLSKQRVVS